MPPWRARELSVSLAALSTRLSAYTDHAPDSTIETLGSDLLWCITKFLPVPDLVALRRVSKQMHAIVAATGRVSTVYIRVTSTKQSADVVFKSSDFTAGITRVEFVSGDGALFSWRLLDNLPALRSVRMDRIPVSRRYFARYPAIPVHLPSIKFDLHALKPSVSAALKPSVSADALEAFVGRRFDVIRVDGVCCELNSARRFRKAFVYGRIAAEMLYLVATELAVSSWQLSHFDGFFANTMQIPESPSDANLVIINGTRICSMWTPERICYLTRLFKRVDVYTLTTRDRCGQLCDALAAEPKSAFSVHFCEGDDTKQCECCKKVYSYTHGDL